VFVDLIDGKVDAAMNALERPIARLVWRSVTVNEADRVLVRSMQCCNLERQCQSPDLLRRHVMSVLVALWALRSRLLGWSVAQGETVHVRRDNGHVDGTRPVAIVT
jgi:hypothetical protein